MTGLLTCVRWFVYKYCMLMPCIICNTNASVVCEINITYLLFHMSEMTQDRHTNRKSQYDLCG